MQRLQKSVTKSLLQILPGAEREEDDEDMMMPSQELSLNYNMSQSSEQVDKKEQKPQTPKLVFSKSEIQQMDKTLKLSQSEIGSLVHLFEIFAIFRKSQDKPEKMESDLAK